MRDMKSASPSHIYAENRKAHFDYEIIEEYEAGIQLFGEEVKSIRNGSINLKGSYILITSGRPFATGIHIGEYKWGMRKLDPKRERELLLNKNQIIRLESKIKEMGATIVPMQVYSKGNLIKVRIALVRGKKTWEKKNTIKERDLNRETMRKFHL